MIKPESHYIFGFAQMDESRATKGYTYHSLLYGQSKFDI